MPLLHSPRFRLVVALWFAALGSLAAADKKVLLIAGTPSHGAGFHEHNAGVLLLQKSLAGAKGLKAEVALNGWPKDPRALEGVDAVVVFADGGRRHPALQDDNLAALGQLAARGGGIGFLHYAVEPTLEKGHVEFLKWVGGAFEINWSVNPHWTADFKTLPKHPITRGVQPFAIKDEWYFNMRFAENAKGLTPILVAVPTPDTMSRKDGPHEGNPHVREKVARKEPQTMAWAYERADGGRGFGFTGAHYHANWANDNFRKLALNAIAWLAKVEVPANGIESKPTEADLNANLDPVDPNTGRKIMPGAAAATPAKK